MCAETLKPPANAMQSLYRSLFLDIERLIPSCDHPLSEKYLFSRLEKEGIRFLLVTLPSLGKATETSLIQEKPLKVPLGFSLKGRSRLPKFLNALFIRVFAEDGTPLHQGGDPVALALIRQVCMMLSKVEGCVDAQLREEKIKEFHARTSGHPKIEWMPEYNLARELLGRVFDREAPLTADLVDFERNPWGRHGPGAVSDKSSAYEKWVGFTRWPGVSPRLFSIGSMSMVTKIGDTRPSARVITVPKDFRGPRVICIEPKEFQFAQQGLMEVLYRLFTTHSLTRGSIRFRDTSLNQALCFSGNADTIDLKDASDHLSLALGRYLLPRWVFRLVTRYRSNHVTAGELTWKPNCLATMGNATCFPLQTIIFWALTRSVMVGLKRYNNCPSYPLRVYGDDIILPKQASSRTLDVLEAAGFTINYEKTCTKQLVKESCGVWVYGGRDTTPVRLKSLDVKSPCVRVAYQDYSVLAGKKGFTSLSCALAALSDEGPAPIRWCKDLQRLEARVPTIATVGHRKALSGLAGLYAWFVRNDTAPFLHGTKIKVKRRWLAAAETP